MQKITILFTLVFFLQRIILYCYFRFFRPPTFKNATQKNNEERKKPVTVKIDRGRTEITGVELRKRSQSAGPGREKLLLSM